MLIILIALLVCFISYKFCKIASNSDNQELEDELFLKTYGHENKNSDSLARQKGTADANLRLRSWVVKIRRLKKI